MTGPLSTLQAVEREPAVKQVHRELRSAILQGRIPVASRLIETSLAQSLNVSRTPVREAIFKLESEGLVRRLRGGGVVVADNSSKLSEVNVIRQSLEGAAVRLACERASDTDLAELAAASHDAEPIVMQAPASTRSDLDREFHLRIARLSQSARLMALIEEFYEYSLSELLPRGGPDSLRLQRQHVQIAEALVARDAEAAEHAVREHLDSVLQLVRRRVGG